MSGSNPATTLVGFPGQGVPAANLVDALRRHEASALVADLLHVTNVQDVNELDLESTADVQPAVVTAGVLAAEEFLSSRGVGTGVVLCGHSLGELTAAVASGCIAPGEGLRLARLRGVLSRKLQQSASKGVLMAVTGLQGADVSLLVDGLRAAGVPVDLAAVNTPRQCVLATLDAYVPHVRQAAVEAGAVTHLLPIDGAFHSRFMAPVVPEYAAALADVPVSRPRMRLFSPVARRELSDPASLRAALESGLLEPVWWWAALEWCADVGCATFVDAGPGAVLARLLRRSKLFNTVEQLAGGA